MNQKVKKYLKIAVTLIIIALFAWFLIAYPLISFRGYEKQMQKAAERYFVTKPGELPTGERLKTLSLQDLFYGAYIKEDFYIPYTKQPCSTTDSWVKIRKENDEYKYYVYLKCGVLSSNIDNKGPTINLNGDEKITVSKNSKFEDPGVKSVVDNKDGNIDVKNVTTKGKVDTSKTGTYEITYSALDSLNNRSEVTRTVEVVERLNSTIKENLKDSDYYKGNAKNNYIYFSSMLFRIIDTDGENVRIVANTDISNVNYNAIDKWLDEVFYEHLNSESKKLIVENKYCNMKGNDNNLNEVKCSSYTSKRKVYIPSIVDVNRAEVPKEENFMRPSTMSWVAGEKDKTYAYITRNFFLGIDNVTSNFMSLPRKYNFGVRPVITIKGDTLIKSGDGTANDPYYLGDVKKGKANSLVSERTTGEYILLNGYIYRIIEAASDGTTKVIATDSIRSDGSYIQTSYEKGDGIYNPTQNGNIGYFINNKISEYVDSSYFVNKNVTVPIYKEDPNYGKEVSTKKYKVKFSAPNTYDMFSSSVGGSYWTINSSQNSKLKNAVSIGVFMYGDVSMSKFGVRPVGYLKKDTTIVSGDGTYDKPYKISK